MSERKVISANDFINRATKLVDIDGFEPGELITIKIRPVSLLAMMTKGKLPNELKATVASLFAQGAIQGKEQVLDKTDLDEIQAMQQLIDKVCEDAMIEPRYLDVADYLTDMQKTQIFTAAQGNVQQLVPNNEE